jgi:hypothetical protein
LTMELTEKMLSISTESGSVPCACKQALG